MAPFDSRDLRAGEQDNEASRAVDALHALMLRACVAQSS